MDQNHCFRFHAECAVLGQNMEPVDPVAEIVLVGGWLRNRMSQNAEGEAALRLVMPRPQPEFVVALRDGAVIGEYRYVSELISVQFRHGLVVFRPALIPRPRSGSIRV